MSRLPDYVPTDRCRAVWHTPTSTEPCVLRVGHAGPHQRAEEGTVLVTTLPASSR